MYKDWDKIFNSNIGTFNKISLSEASRLYNTGLRCGYYIYRNTNIEDYVRAKSGGYNTGHILNIITRAKKLRPFWATIDLYVLEDYRLVCIKTDRTEYYKVSDNV